MSDWLFCQLVDAESLIIPREPFQVGHFELSNQPEPFSPAEEALRTSVSSFALNTDRSYLRMRTTLIESNARQARREGRLHAREALTLFRHGYPGAPPIKLLEPGYILRLDNLEATPFTPPASHTFGSMMLIPEERAQNPAFLFNRVMRLGDESGELGRALRRSAHWSALVENIDDVGERLLMQWLAIECLTRALPDESIVGKICAATSLPSGQLFRQLPEQVRLELLRDPRFKTWTSYASRLVERLRITRNQIAHNGYREIDLREAMTHDEVVTASRLMRLAVGGAQHLAVNGLALDLRSITELWDNYGRCLMHARQVPLATEVFGTVIVVLTERADPDDDL